VTFQTRLYLLLALAATGSVSALQAGPIDALYVFGDSTSDVGNVYTFTGGALPGPPYFNGQFSNGSVWAQDLTGLLGLAPLTPSLLGGTDYAYGGAETGVTTFNTAVAGSDLLGSTGQLAQFAMTHAAADPNALYIIWIGSNDLIDIFTSATPAQYGADIGIVASNIDTAIGTLAGLGARNFLLLTAPDLGIGPQTLAQGPAVAAAASALSAAFDATLVSGSGPIPSLAALAAINHINVSVLNTYALFDTIVANPGTYGFTNVTQPCLTGAVNYSGGTPCANPDQYLFWDDLHATAAANKIVAGAALSVIAPEPGSISLVAAGILVLAMLRRC
jgi:outer membrane lipase/esterase